MKEKGDRMDLMKPILTMEVPAEGFVYEIKYDGFRAILHWSIDSVQLVSKRNKDLTNNFPEIIQYCQEKSDLIKDYLPLKLDGELVILNNDYQANFSLLQTRGRLKNKATIAKQAHTRPATFMAFDIIHQKCSDFIAETYLNRKQTLHKILAFIEEGLSNRVVYVPFFEQRATIWEIIFAFKGEGILAKRKTSKYIAGKKHVDWYKVKNWRTIRGFLTSYDPRNNYYTVSVYRHDEVYHIGKCKHGLDEETSGTLQQMFITQGEKKNNSFVLPPAICANIYTLDLHGNELREPKFSNLNPNMRPEDCTVEQLKVDLAMLPSTIELTNLTKVFWDEERLTKGDLLTYIREISPYMLPFLQDKALTVIRCPDGVAGESFFQKSLPTYAPSFINSQQIKDKNIIICDHLDALIWFANHGAIEYHIPFQTVSQKFPNEIAFDLDPPSRKEFKSAIFAAKLIKQILDELGLISFIKTSGSKGLQIHIPIPTNSMSYEDTAIFTEAIATTLVNNYPNTFTIERLKKKRADRLYIDYVQHGKDKTLIAPYSPRIRKEASVATPLFWEELTEDLTPDLFTIKNVLERVQTVGCPFENYFEIGEQQVLDKFWQLIH